MKKVILLSALALLTACGGGGGSSSDSDGSNALTISATGSDSTVNRQGEFDLSITGSGNDIIIKKGNTINNLEISGSANDVLFEENTSVKDFRVSGTGNDIFVPVDSEISFIDTGTGNKLITTVTNSIAGTYSYTYPISQCIETIQFSADGSYDGTSLDEVVSGTYEFDEIAISGEYHLLSITITSDNGLADCNGLSEDNTGDNFLFYVNFPSATEIEIFEEETDVIPFVVFTKQ